MDKVTVASREITYRMIVEQVFFEDETELLVRTGWPEEDPLEEHITYEWATGTEPEWAEGYSFEELLG